MTPEAQKNALADIPNEALGQITSRLAEIQDIDMGEVDDAQVIAVLSEMVAVMGFAYVAGDPDERDFIMMLANMNASAIHSYSEMMQAVEEAKQ